jgi:hypothetical protein
MNELQPFGWLAPAAQRRATAVLLALTLLVAVALQAIGGPLANQAAPSGIVAFEFAGELAVAERILESWGDAGRTRAGLSLGLDYLFLVLYASALALACAGMGRWLSRHWRGAAAVGAALAWGQLAAGLLDAVENFALIRLLLGSDGAAWPLLAWWCAAAKFSLVGAGLVYLLAGLALAVTARGRDAGGP